MKEISFYQKDYETAYDYHQNGEEPKHNKRVKKFKTFELNFLAFVLKNKPRTISKILSTPKAPFWKEVINSKIDSIMQNNT